MGPKVSSLRKLLPEVHPTKMEIYPSRQEAAIIHIAAIVLGSWHIYRDWDGTTEKAMTVWNWFRSHPEAQPAQPTQPER